MRALALLALVVSLEARAQFVLSFPGQRPGGGAVLRGGGSGPAIPLPQSFVIYGDSIATGFCNTTPPHLALAALLPGYVAENLAQSGTTTDQISARYFATRDEACAGERCGTYIFQGGVNNIKNGPADTDAMLADMLSAIDDARGRHRRVIWVNVAPFRGCGFCVAPDAGWELAKAYNVKVATACAARPDITCIDVGSGSAWEQPPTDGFLLSSWSCDGIHWLQGGTDALAALLRNAFPL